MCIEQQTQDTMDQKITIFILSLDHPFWTNDIKFVCSPDFLLFCKKNWMVEMEE